MDRRMMTRMIVLSGLSVLSLGATTGFAANVAPGDLLVAEYEENGAGNCRVLHYDASGNYVEVFAQGGDLTHRLTDIVITPDGLHVLIARPPEDAGTGAVLKYTIDGTPLGAEPGLDNLTGGPNALAFDDTGNLLYVTFTGNDGAGSPSLVEHDMSTGQNTEIFGVGAPTGVAVSSLTGHLFVASAADHRVHEFARVGGTWTEECVFPVTSLEYPYDGDSGR